MTIKPTLFDQLVAKCEEAGKKRHDGNGNINREAVAVWLAWQDAAIIAYEYENKLFKEIAELHCPQSSGFEGPDTYCVCGKCIVCRTKEYIANHDYKRQPKQQQGDQS